MADHHGVANHVCANILWAHLSGDREGHALAGPTVTDRLAFLNSDGQAFYTACQARNRLPPFKVENITDGDWPVLKGNNVKAINTRALVPYVLALQQRATKMVQSPKTD